MYVVIFLDIFNIESKVPYLQAPCKFHSIIASCVLSLLPDFFFQSTQPCFSSQSQLFIWVLSMNWITITTQTRSPTPFSMVRNFSFHPWSGRTNSHGCLMSSPGVFTTPFFNWRPLAPNPSKPIPWARRH